MVGALLAIAGSLPIVRVMRDGRSAALRSLFPTDLRAARVLGERYLEIEPRERSASWLARELFGQPSLSMADGRGLDWLKDRVRASRARDFERGDLVLLDGWFLARTEARLLALCAILPVP